MRGSAAGIRPALTGLTTRGRSFVAAGTAAMICAVILGQRDLLRVGILLVTVPLSCAVVLGRARYQLSLTRTITAQRVRSGTAIRVRLELENLTRFPTRVLLAEDQVPYSLGPSPRFVLARLASGRRAAITYSLRPSLRGRYLIGPLRLHLTDPFGMCELTKSFTTTNPLVVVPWTYPLAPVQANGLWSGSGDSLARRAAASGENDVTIREHRYGDDLRRIHWRSTARRGKLMVRCDEQPRQLQATALLDSRQVGHRGEGPASSFEWAVVAAASITEALSEQQYDVRLVCDEHPAVWTGPSSGVGSGRLLDELAVVGWNGSESLAGALTRLAEGNGAGLVVAVLGEIGDKEALMLAGLGAGGQGTRRIAVLLRTTAWTVLPPPLAADADANREHASAILRSGGWLVTDAGPEETMAQVWQRVNVPTAETVPRNPPSPVSMPARVPTHASRAS